MQKIFSQCAVSQLFFLRFELVIQYSLFSHHSIKHLYANFGAKNQLVPIDSQNSVRTTTNMLICLKARQETYNYLATQAICFVQCLKIKLACCGRSICAVMDKSPGPLGFFDLMKSRLFVYNISLIWVCRNSFTHCLDELYFCERLLIMKHFY